MVPQLLLCLFMGMGIPPVSANVEKTIFLGPEPVNIPQQHPTLSDLNIDLLTPETWSLRTHLEAIFPTAGSEKGKSTWLILDNLTESQRYEVRICWLATQPTEFHLETYTLPTVFETPELITSLYNYSITRQPPPPSTDGGDKEGNSPAFKERQSSILFLRIDAAADYFSTNRTLMEHPEPVVVDIILDPFVLNVLPRTLVPTVGYVVCIAALSWVLSTRLTMPWVRGLMVGGGGGDSSMVAEQERKRQ
ncbi:hypothetical protein VP1G_09236 [Cytospora mali]|uniref:Uncharacterized protein n=1 Tax=Cytospora mali TaxID=578113 RepID=A0A194VDZ6_CYTMA|nr:hypothetical protein VP1G_09236 [Valsa mali var. pyri (nom. inval.)]